MVSDSQQCCCFFSYRMKKKVCVIARESPRRLLPNWQLPKGLNAESLWPILGLIMRCCIGTAPPNHFCNKFYYLAGPVKKLVDAFSTSCYLRRSYRKPAGTVPPATNCKALHNGCGTVLPACNSVQFWLCRAGSLGTFRSGIEWLVYRVGAWDWEKVSNPFPLACCDMK